MQLEKIQQEKSQQILTILNRLALFYKIIFFSIIAFLAVIIIKNFISGGIGDGIITLIFSVIVGIFAISFLFKILNSTVGKIQYSRCISLLKSQISESAFNANVLHTNSNPPGIFAIDSQAKQVFVNNQQTGYYPVLLNKNTILSKIILTITVEMVSLLIKLSLTYRMTRSTIVNVHKSRSSDCLNQINLVKFFIFFMRLFISNKIFMTISWG